RGSSERFRDGTDGEHRLRSHARGIAEPTDPEAFGINDPVVLDDRDRNTGHVPIPHRGGNVLLETPESLDRGASVLCRGRAGPAYDCDCESESAHHVEAVLGEWNQEPVRPTRCTAATGPCPLMGGARAPRPGK